MQEKDEDLLDEILNEILRSSPGVRYVLLMDRTGLSISYTVKFKTDKEMNVERLGAIAGAVFQAVEEQGDCVDYGETLSQITEYEQGFIFSMSAGDGILCVVTEQRVNMGLIRTSMKRYRGRLAKILSRYLHQDSSQISEELKGLFKENQFV